MRDPESDKPVNQSRHQLLVEVVKQRSITHIKRRPFLENTYFLAKQQVQRDMKTFLLYLVPPDIIPSRGPVHNHT